MRPRLPRGRAREGPALRQGAAKLPNRQKLLGTPPPSRPKSEGLRGKLGEGTRVRFPVRSAQRLTPSDPPTIRTPYPQLGRHHSPTLGHPKTSSLTRPAGLRRCQSGHPQGWRRFQLPKHWRQPASAAGPCATPASRAPGSFSVAGGKSWAAGSDPGFGDCLQHQCHRLCPVGFPRPPWAAGPEHLPSPGVPASLPAHAAMGGGDRDWRRPQLQIRGLGSLLQPPGATCAVRSSHPAGSSCPERPQRCSPAPAPTSPIRLSFCAEMPLASNNFRRAPRSRGV